MTTIRDIGVPRVEGEVRTAEQRKLDKATTSRRVVVGLAIGALVLTVGNLVASTYLLRTVNDLRALNARLEDMAGMEKRIRASLDVLNTGFQSKLDDLGGEVHDQITALEDGVGQLQRRLDLQTSTAALPQMSIEPEPPTALSPAAEPTPDEAQATADSQEGAVADDTPVVAVEAPKPRKPKPAPASRVGSSYQRIETPDGKVYYRRIQ